MDIDPQSSSAACDGIEDSFSALSLNINFGGSLELTQALYNLGSGVYTKEMVGLVALRKLLAIEVNPPIHEVISSNIAASLITMAYTRPKEFAFEVSWVLCNIGSGDGTCTKYLLDINCLEFFDKIFYLDPNSFDLRDQIVWAIGNIAGESIHCRDLIIRSEICNKILLYSEAITIAQIKEYRILVWAFGNLARGKPHFDSQFCLKLVKIFQQAILQTDDIEILVDACWGLSSILDDMNFSELFSDYLLKKLIFLTISSSVQIILPSLRILASFISNFSDSYQRVIPLGMIQAIMTLMGHEKQFIRTEVMLICSNLCAENDSVITIMIQNGFYSNLITRICDETDSVLQEIISVIDNSTQVSSRENAKLLIEMGWIEKTLSVFSKVQHKSKLAIIEGITELFKKYPEAINEEISGIISKTVSSSNLSDEIIDKLQAILMITFEQFYYLYMYIFKLFN